MIMRATATPGVVRAGLLAATLLVAALPAHAQDLTAPTRDTAPRLSVQTPYGLSSGGAQGSYYFQTTPGTAFNSYNATRGFTDLSVAQPLGIGRELGIGNVSATLGARVADPLIANGFTPPTTIAAISVSARVSALQGNAPVGSSWNVEWQVGASMLFGNSTADGGATYNPVTSYAGSQSGSVVNVDGLLGLSHWFDAASKLTLGYRADAHFKNTQNQNFGVPPAQNADRIDHGPMVRFTVQK